MTSSPIAPDRNRARGCLLGLASGDAIGTTVEFHPRGSFAPLTDLVGGGPFRLSPGAWTDDTSMALCLADSLVEVGRFDAGDQMRRYCRWRAQGYRSSTGRCFDIGSTIAAALDRFEEDGDPFAGSTDPYSAGNGCIMRLAPVVLFFRPDRERVIHWAAQSARTTHGALECLEACRLLAAILDAALAGASKEEILFGHGLTDIQAPSLRSIAEGEYRAKTAGQIQGTGYVVKSLEAALWCFHRAGNYREAVLMAANLGDDADTTAAVCGQIAGAHYGEAGIPEGWLQRLVMADEIRKLADRLLDTVPQPETEESRFFGGK